MSSLCVVSVPPFALEHGFHKHSCLSSRASKVEETSAGIGCCIPDGVTGSQSDPLRDRSVLLLSSGELLLRAEGLVALCRMRSASIFKSSSRSPPSARSVDAPSNSQSSASKHSQKIIVGRTYRHRDDCRGVEACISLRVVVESFLTDLQISKLWDLSESRDCACLENEERPRLPETDWRLGPLMCVSLAEVRPVAAVETESRQVFDFLLCEASK